jgi:serine/threonine protein phosphatase 1
MKRTIVISDIHGCIKRFLQLINEVNYKPHEDHLILLGDYVDRGPDSRQVVEEVMRLVREDGAIALQGNHDERFVEVVKGVVPTALEKFLTHGGRQTLESYAGADASLEDFRHVVSNRYADHLAFLDDLPYYYEDDRFIYVHAGIHPMYADKWKEQPKRDFLYMKEPFLSQRTAAGKTVIFGHTRTSELHGKPDVWFGEGKIGIDGGCAYGQQLNALVIYGPDNMDVCAVSA